MQTKYFVLKNSDEAVMGIITYTEENATSFKERVAECLGDYLELPIAILEKGEEELDYIVTCAYAGERDIRIKDLSEGEETTVYINQASIY